MSGTIYVGGEHYQEYTDLLTKAYGMYAWTNPLHANVFPGVRQMEVRNSNWSKMRVWRLANSFLIDGEQICLSNSGKYPKSCQKCDRTADARQPHHLPYSLTYKAELISMCVAIFGGDDEACGCHTSGGTESIIMAIKVRRQTPHALQPKRTRGMTTKRNRRSFSPGLPRLRTNQARHHKAQHGRPAYGAPCL